MRLSKSFHYKLQGEVLDKVDKEIRALIRKATKDIANDPNFYLDKLEIKELKNLSKYKKWLSYSDLIKIEKKHLPIAFREWRKLNTDRRHWFAASNEAYIKLRIEPVLVPKNKQSELLCLKSTETILKDVFEKIIKREELESILKKAEASCFTPKRLRQVLIGIDKLAPSTMKEADINPNTLPMISYDLEKFVEPAA